MPPFPPLRPMHPAARKTLKGVSSQPGRFIADALLGDPSLTDAVESFGMGATGPMGAGKRGIEAFAAVRKGTKSLADLIERSPWHVPGVSFKTTPDLAKLAARSDDDEILRVMLNASPDELALDKAFGGHSGGYKFSAPPPMSAQPRSVQAMANKYEVYDPKATMDDLSRNVQRSVRDGQSEHLPLQDLGMLMRRRFSQEGVAGMLRPLEEGQASVSMFDPRRVKILERLAALGLSSSAIQEMMARIKTDRTPSTPAGGW